MSMRLVHLDGRPSQTLRTVEAVVSDMVWSPDGRQIAVTLNLPHSVGIAQTDFAYIMNADGSGIRPNYRHDDSSGGKHLLSAGTSSAARSPKSHATVAAVGVLTMAGITRGQG